MTNRQSIDWRRLAAMLCIALAVVFAFDFAAAATGCTSADCAAACELGACDHQDENGAPCAKHHCCCHGASACEPGMGRTIAIRESVKLGVSWREAFVASGYLDTLERPPKTTATVI